MARYQPASFRRPAFVFILLQLLLVLVMTALAAFTPGDAVRIDASRFSIDNRENASLEKQSLVVEASGEGATDLRTAAVYPLKANAYDVCIRYDSDTDGTHDRKNAAGTLYLESGSMGRLMSVDLRDGAAVLNERLQLPLTASCDDLYLELTCRVGTLTLYDVSLTENIGYRFVKIAAVLLLFCFVDLACYLCFAPAVKTSGRTRRQIALAGIALFASLPFLADYIPSGHDTYFHLSRIYSLAEEMRNGQFPVRMFTMQYNGYGYPSPLYYCTFFLYLPALLYNGMLSLESCYAIYVLCINLLTCAVAYYSFSKMTRKPMLATALYALNLYRLINLYTRGAVGEYTAMAFLPLVLLGIHQIYSKEKISFGDWLPLSLGMTGVVLSHILTTELVVLNLLAFCGLFLKRTLKPARIWAILKSAALCLLLCAWFWVPFLDTYLAQSVAVQNQEVRFIQQDGLYLAQLLSLFTSGGGNNEPFMYMDMPLSLGGGMVAAMGCILYALLKHHEQFGGFGKRPVQTVLLFVLGNSLLSMAFFPWRKIQSVLGTQPGQIGHLIGTLQFPWRFLVIVVPLLAAGGVWALEKLESCDRSAYRAFACAIIAGLILSSSFYQYQYTSSALPRDVDTLVNSSSTQVDTLYLFNPDDQFCTARTACTSSDEQMQAANYRKENGVASVHVLSRSNETTTLTVPIFGYRNYVALDAQGNELEWQRGENNCIAIRIPPRYEGVVSVSYMPPAVWRAAEAVSLLSLIGLMIYGLCDGNRKRKLRAATAPKP